nr:unnamed protein product [Callosobruchus analis]
MIIYVPKKCTKGLLSKQKEHKLTQKEKKISNFSIKTDKGITTNPEEISNHFNTYFKHIAAQVISKTAPRINIEQ